MKKFIKPTLCSLLIILISIFILTIFNYIGILKRNILIILGIIIISISFIINGYLTGKNTIKKGWLTGLESGSILLFFLVLLSIFLKIKFNIKMLIFYIALLSLSSIGSIIGINKKSN